MLHFKKGMWARGQMLPSIDKLMDEFDVGRVTVRQAIQTLVKEGLLNHVEADVADKTKTAPGSSSGGSRKPRNADRRREEIIASAASCFMERGYHATSIDDVARRLKSTKGRIYHYYGSKTDLFFDVHRVGMDHLFEALAPALETEGDGAAVLRAMLMAHAKAMLEYHTFENVVAQGVQLHRFDAMTPDQRQTMRELIDSRDKFEKFFKDRIAAGIKDGSIRKVDVSVTAKVLIGGLQWSIFWYRPREDDTPASRKRLARKMVDPLMEGLSPKQGSVPTGAAA